MTEISVATRHLIVSQYARGRRTQAIADMTALPVAVVSKIGQEHGAPDMGKLAAESDRLRKAMDEAERGRHQVDGQPASAGLTAADNLAALLAEAERIGHVRLASRAKYLATQLDQLRTDLAAATKAHAEKVEKEAKRARLAELKAEEAKLRAELRGPSAPKSKAKPRGKAAPKSPSEASVIREWAKGAGVECPDFGRIPASVRTAYEQAVA